MFFFGQHDYLLPIDSPMHSNNCNCIIPIVLSLILFQMMVSIANIMVNRYTNKRGADIGGAILGVFLFLLLGGGGYWRISLFPGWWI